ncbi:zinc-binding dehydrogenase protein [Rutstroemia sp. NJR-2017a WRK4]|nr:zinc-binding dehydrogenase protein [Rutstroemia sp. NJR-2017a WRK4]
MSSASKTPSNQAVWLQSCGTLEVKAAPYTHPEKNEIVIKNRALAINPADWIKQDMGSFMFPWMKYPCVMGYDVAGEVVEIGPGVTRFKVGDRVVGMANGTSKALNTPTKSGFQLYPVLLDHMTSHIPSTLSFEQACVIPLGLSTAACGLFQKDLLGLQLPSISPKPTGQTVLIWGGSSSVGVNAIQLAVAAGYEVITTCSPRNFELVKRLGASQAFDYNSKTVVVDIIRALQNVKVAGAISIGKGAIDACMDILDKCQGNKFLAMMTYPLPTPPPKHFVIPKTVATFVPWMATNYVKCKTRGIKNAFVEGSSLTLNGIGEAVYANFLSDALEKGTFVAAPEPKVVGTGLEFVEAAMKIQREGVSACKVVVALD